MHKDEMKLEKLENDINTICNNDKNLTQIEMYHVMEDGPVIPKILQTIKEGDYEVNWKGRKSHGWNIMAAIGGLALIGNLCLMMLCILK